MISVCMLGNFEVSSVFAFLGKAKLKQGAIRPRYRSGQITLVVRYCEALSQLMLFLFALSSIHAHEKPQLRTKKCCGNTRSQHKVADFASSKRGAQAANQKLDPRLKTKRFWAALA